MIVLVETGAGFWAGSLSLVMDALHNLSDELALLLLWFAYAASRDLSQNLLRAANLFNTVGLIAMSLLVIVQAAIELRDPQPLPGWVPALVGLWILGGTLRELGRSHAELLWPGRIECGPAAHHRD